MRSAGGACCRPLPSCARLDPIWAPSQSVLRVPAPAQIAFRWTNGRGSGRYRMIAVRVIVPCRLYMENRMFLVLCLLCLFGASDSLLLHAQTNSLEVSSPDHQIDLSFKVLPASKKQTVGPDGQLVYSVTFHQKKIFEDSALRLELANQAALGAAVHITHTTTGSGVDNYTLVAGKTSSVHDPYNSLIVQARESGTPGRVFEIEARVYN